MDSLDLARWHMAIEKAVRTSSTRDLADIERELWQAYLDAVSREAREAGTPRYELPVT